MIVFDGKAFAAQKETQLREKISTLRRPILVRTFTFQEDEGSRLYTRLKAQAAERVGISYSPLELPLHTSVREIVDQVRSASEDSSVHGVMIQKPAKVVWQSVTSDASADAFENWWNELTLAIDPKKDVDCLTATNLDQVFQCTDADDPSLLLPATVRACHSILQIALTQLQIPREEWSTSSAVVIGRSDIVGKPLAAILRAQGFDVLNIGRRALILDNESLRNADIVVSATGVPNLVTGSMVKQDVILVDVGSPKGDIEFETVKEKARFITPVPGGVGPVTVSSLLENIYQVTRQNS